MTHTPHLASARKWAVCSFGFIIDVAFVSAVGMIKVRSWPSHSRLPTGSVRRRDWTENENNDVAHSLQGAR